MYEMSQRHPVWVAENHVSPCNSVEAVRVLLEAVRKIIEAVRLFVEAVRVLVETVESL